MQVQENIITTIQTILQPFSKNAITPEAIQGLCEDGAEKQEISKDELLTYDEACRLLNVSKMTLHNWKNQGLIKVIKPMPNSHKAYVLRSSIKFDL